MAKTLPQITLTDAQYARVAKIIPGKTAAEKVAAYETMVKDMLRDLVVRADVDEAREAANALIREAEAAARDNADNL
jgi:Spy/CpxP family protein refolding chaperone